MVGCRFLRTGAAGFFARISYTLYPVRINVLILVSWHSGSIAGAALTVLVSLASYRLPPR
jgi:hypothetical protein